MIMMECLGLSFLDWKVTKVVTNSASICRLARHMMMTMPMMAMTRLNVIIELFAIVCS
jgi:hypothetical protein